ncbi:MAG: tetratricopeptide repeat protein [Gemmatimonadales bacterium]|nr:MAG: tetratricopeptide repeat protein [Gemmatimonadales bacterium]
MRSGTGSPVCRSSGQTALPPPTWRASPTGWRREDSIQLPTQLARGWSARYLASWCPAWSFTLSHAPGMNFEKLKETARRYEQKEDWRRAIEVYLQAVREFESGHEPIPDLSVYNRIGDLYLKANESGAAVQAYERAVDLYGEQGFYNNAIALCGKILRVNPGRTQTYLKLAHLHARKNVVIEAKKNLLEYLDRMHAQGHLDEAFKAVTAFAEQ